MTSPRKIAVPRRLAWVALPAQVVLTGAVAAIALAAVTVVGGVFTEGFQVIGIAVVATPITILAFVVGLPLRLVTPLRSWWFRRPVWVLLAFVAGVVGLVVSFFVGAAGPVHHAATADWPASDGWIPDPGVFAVTLGAVVPTSMHLLPPRRVWPAMRDTSS